MSPVKSPEEFGARDVGKKDKIVVGKDEAEELPPGWTKEVKTRKAGSATKKDRFYTDPVTGYIFRSLKDVQRYLKTGEIGRLAIKPKIDEREKPSELKERMSETLTNKQALTDKCELPARASKRLAGNSDALLPSPSESLPEPKTRQATRLAGVAVEAPPEPKTHHATRLAEVTVEASVPSPPEPKTRQAARQAGIKIDSPPPLPSYYYKTHPPTPQTEIGPSQPEPKTRLAKRASGTQDYASPSQPKTRRATQQAGITINSPPPSSPDTRIRSRAPKENDKNTEAENTTDKHNENADMDANTNHNQENKEKQELHNILPPVTPKEHNKQIEAVPTTSRPPEAQPPPTVVPPVNLEKQESPVVNSTISNPVPQYSHAYGGDMKPDSSFNFSMNDLWTDPCIEFAVKTLTGAIPFTDLNKVENFTAPATVPLEELWTDPCIEFAVKTLTGAIPVGEDDHFLHRPASSTNPQGAHTFSSPMNVCQTGHNTKQQDSVFPTLGNGGLQKSGQFVSGANGQCSRSRFFQ